MSIVGMNYIGYTTSGQGVKKFNALNPNTGETLQGTFVEATREEVGKAAQKARDAFDLYRAKSKEERALFLEAIADEIIALGDELVQRAMEETSLPNGRIVGERERATNQLRMFAQVVRDGSWQDIRIDKGDPDRTPAPKPDIRQMQVPLGPVGIFGASNFPLAFSVAGGDTASALAAGCPVVVKGHPLHPGTSELISQAILSAAQKTEMPDGVFSMVQGASVDVGMAMVKHPEIMAIGFTGSYKGGKAIFDAANKRPVPIPVFAEMGSTNPVFILPHALGTRSSEIAQGLCTSLNMGVGQFCTNPGLLISVTGNDTNQLLESMSGELTCAMPGNMLSSGIQDNYNKGVEHLLQSNGVELAASSETSPSAAGVSSNLFSTDSNTFLENHSFSQEVFGPCTMHVAADNKGAMLEIARGLEGHLTATILATDEEIGAYQELISILEKKVGRLIFNGYPTGVEVCNAMVHGGPFPATTAPQSTSVGTGAIKRFARPVCYQNFPQQHLPPELQDENVLKIMRFVDGEWIV